MKRRKTTTEFIEDARQIHGETYNYSKVNYVTAHEKVEIICQFHGSFMQRAADHLNLHGCPTCGGIAANTKIIQKQKSIFVDGQSLFDIKYKKIHEKRNQNKDYGKRIKGSIEKAKLDGRWEIRQQKRRQTMVDKGYYYNDAERKDNYYTINHWFIV